MLIMKQYNGRYDHKGAEDNMNKKNNSKWMYISIAAIVLLITVSVLYFSKIAADSKSAQEVKSKKKKTEPNNQEGGEGNETNNA